MKRPLLATRLTLSTLALTLGLGTMAQTPVITSFSRNGQLVCSNLAGGTTAVVEWASSVAGPWHSNWTGLDAVAVDANGAISVGVPMFYRVRGTLPQTNLFFAGSATYQMGSPDTEVDRNADETQHPVTLSRGFYMSRYLVTQGDFLTLMGYNPSIFTIRTLNGYDISPDLNRPVESVTWDEATNYCALLTAREAASGRLPTGYVYRLPTEAEWEYACRAGTTTRFSYGDDPQYAELSQYAWYGGLAGLCTQPVGSKAPNPWGLFDMHGGVWEWCLDWYGAYPGTAVTDPQGPGSGEDRVLRGGCWYDSAKECRSARRSNQPPSTRSGFIGFRVVLAQQ